MRYTAAYLLASLGGKISPDVADIAKILGSVGIDCDEERAQKVIDACIGRNVDEIIADGMKKIDDVSTLNTSPTPTEPTAPILVPRNSTPPRTPSPPGTPDDTDFVSLYFILQLLFLSMFLIGWFIRLTRIKANKKFVSPFYGRFLYCTIKAIKYRLVLSNMKY